MTGKADDSNARSGLCFMMPNAHNEGRAPLLRASLSIVLLGCSANNANTRSLNAAQFSAPINAATRIANHSWRSEEHTSELQSHSDLVCRLLLEKKKKNKR